MTIQINSRDKKFLLTVARTSIEDHFRKEKQVSTLIKTADKKLCEYGASFVTLTKNENLRGCIGALSAYQPLVQDVCEHAAAAAFNDYRFPSLKLQEVGVISIEISYLTPPKELVYTDDKDLLQKLVKDEDGVILGDGYHQATYLPQVWAQIPDKKEFLSNLCLKMGLSSNAWQKKHLTVEIYKVIHFSEK